MHKTQDAIQHLLHDIESKMELKMFLVEYISKLDRTNNMISFLMKRIEHTEDYIKTQLVNRTNKNSNMLLIFGIAVVVISLQGSVASSYTMFVRFEPFKPFWPVVEYYSNSHLYFSLCFRIC